MESSGETNVDELFLEDGSGMEDLLEPESGEEDKTEQTGLEDDESTDLEIIQPTTKVAPKTRTTVRFIDDHGDEIQRTGSRGKVSKGFETTQQTENDSKKVLE